MVHVGRGLALLDKTVYGNANLQFGAFGVTASNHEDDEPVPEIFFVFQNMFMCEKSGKLILLLIPLNSFMLPAINVASENPCPELWLNMHDESDLTSSTLSLP